MSQNESLYECPQCGSTTTNLTNGKCPLCCMGVTNHNDDYPRHELVDEHNVRYWYNRAKEAEAKLEYPMLSIQHMSYDSFLKQFIISAYSGCGQNHQNIYHDDAKYNIEAAERIWKLIGESIGTHEHDLNQ